MPDEPQPGSSGINPPDSRIQQAATNPRTSWDLVANGPQRPDSVRTVAPALITQIQNASQSPRRWWEFWKSGKAETPRNTQPMREAPQPPPITPRP